MSEPKPEKLVLEYFSYSRVDLMIEVNRHPALCELLRAQALGAEWADQIGEIAAYLNIVMDGVYSPTDLDLVIYPDLMRRLENRRSIIIT